MNQAITTKTKAAGKLHRSSSSRNEQQQQEQLHASGNKRRKRIELKKKYSFPAAEKTNAMSMCSKRTQRHRSCICNPVLLNCVRECERVCVWNRNGITIRIHGLGSGYGYSYSYGYSYGSDGLKQFMCHVFCT